MLQVACGTGCWTCCWHGGTRCGREPPSFSFYRYTTAPTLHGRPPTCLDARVAPSLCQGHHLSTAHAAHAAPAVVMRDTCCFFCLLDTGTHGKKQKRRWHLDTGRPASKRSANSGGCLETVSHSIPPQSWAGGCGGQQLVTAFSPTSLLKLERVGASWSKLERVVEPAAVSATRLAKAGSWSCHGPAQRLLA